MQPYWKVIPGSIEQEFQHKKIIELHSKGYSTRQIAKFDYILYSKSYINKFINIQKNKQK